jgi:hypothetical protein
VKLTDILGEQYRLKVKQIEKDEPESVKLKGGYFVICSLKKGDKEHVKKQLDGWYRKKAGRNLMNG